MAVKTWSAGEVLAAADLNDTFASKLDTASWTAYTPTFSGGSWAVGNGSFVNDTSYIQLGKLVVFVGAFVFGSTTTTDGSSALDISLPVTASGNAPMAGVAGFLDSGTANYAGIIGFNTTSTMRPNRIDANNMAYSGLTTNSPFTWATNDTIRWMIVYKAA
jgi:hypothetical protein